MFKVLIDLLIEISFRRINLLVYLDINRVKNFKYEPIPIVKAYYLKRVFLIIINTSSISLISVNWSFNIVFSGIMWRIEYFGTKLSLLWLDE